MIVEYNQAPGPGMLSIYFTILAIAPVVPDIITAVTIAVI
jgi:hypothetical protein